MSDVKFYVILVALLVMFIVIQHWFDDTRALIRNQFSEAKEWDAYLELDVPILLHFVRETMTYLKRCEEYEAFMQRYDEWDFTPGPSSPADEKWERERAAWIQELRDMKEDMAVTLRSVRARIVSQTGTGRTT